MFTKSFPRIVSIIGRLALIAMMILLVGPVTPARADTTHCGPINADTNWSAAGNNHIVTCLVQVMPGVTLTIESGARVLFDNGVSMRIDGELIARGVTFSSSSGTPSKGIWGHIFFSTTSEDAVFDGGGNYLSGSILQDSLVAWGGGGTGVVGAVSISGASPFLDNNNIFNSSTRGVYASGRSSSQVIHISRNTVNANNGGGIYITNALLDDNQVYDNTGNKEGGGVYAINSQLNNNNVYNNDGSNGGGIFASGCVLDANTVSGNSGDRNGGGIFAEGSTLTDNTVTGNTLSNTYPTQGGGIRASGGSLTNNTVSGNSIYTDWGEAQGGGIYSALGTVLNNTVTDNTILPGDIAYGGGIFSAGSSVTGNTIRGNAATAESDNVGYGGGVFADGGTVSENTIEANNVGGGYDNLGGGVYGEIATIDNNTFIGNNAHKGGAIYAQQGMVSSNTVLTNTASLTGTVYIEGGAAIGNILRGNTAAYAGGLFGSGATLTGNTLENNTAIKGGGIQAINSTVNGNTLTGNTALSDGGGIHATGGTVSGNTISENTAPSYGHGSGAYIIDVTDFSNNNVLDNTAPGGTAGGVSVNGQPVLHYNNLYGNTPYDAEVISELPVDATLNYWGLSACTAIPNQIYDGNDAPGRGILTYAPSLYSAVPFAQLDFPSELTLSESETSITLSWTPIPSLPSVGCRLPGSSEPDVGYLVYYGDQSCAPYDGTGLPEGVSPIDVGVNTSLTLSGVSDSAIYFAVAAYDYLDRRSAYSNEVGTHSTEPGHTSVFLPMLGK